MIVSRGSGITKRKSNERDARHVDFKAEPIRRGHVFLKVWLCTPCEMTVRA